MVAGHGGQHMIDALLQAGRDAKLGEFIRHIAHDTGNIGLADGGGHLAHQHCALPEAFQHEAAPRQHLRGR